MNFQEKGEKMIDFCWCCKWYIYLNFTFCFVFKYKQSKQSLTSLAIREIQLKSQWDTTTNPPNWQKILFAVFSKNANYTSANMTISDCDNNVDHRKSHTLLVGL